MFMKGDIVELIEDTPFYKKGTRAVVCCCPCSGNKNDMEIRFEYEIYEGCDVDAYPIRLFQLVH